MTRRLIQSQIALSQLAAQLGLPDRLTVRNIAFDHTTARVIFLIEDPEADEVAEWAEPPFVDYFGPRPSFPFTTSS